MEYKAKNDFILPWWGFMEIEKDTTFMDIDTLKKKKEKDGIIKEPTKKIDALIFVFDDKLKILKYFSPYIYIDNYLSKPKEYWSVEQFFKDLEEYDKPKEMGNRNYNNEHKDTETRKYTYNFDFDVMHPLMIKSFLPFIHQGNLLELGCFKGDFTKRLAIYFDDVTCVEASKEAISEAIEKVKHLFPIKHMSFIESTFEKVGLTETYNNIVMTHVLEHLDNPVAVLKRINDEWLSKEGVLLLVVPNANAASRQIAVKMGLIPHNTSVTPDEEAHGHKRTYNMNTLEWDVRQAGLKVIHRSGIFFKALANFQMDQVVEQKIVSPEYLEACYELGHMYPDLCSSLFLVCKKGK